MRRCSGDMRVRNGGSKPAIYFETSDAGSLFRFTDTYPRMMGGQMWIAMDPPTADHAPQDGVLNVRDFIIRGEAALDRVVAGAAGRACRTGVEFQRMRVEFTRQPGRLILRDGVVRGPIVGATIDGHIDYSANDVRLRGTFVPLYGLNNAIRPYADRRPVPRRRQGRPARAHLSRSSVRRAARCCASIRFRLWRRACCASSSSSPPTSAMSERLPEYRAAAIPAAEFRPASAGRGVCVRAKA